MSNLVQVNTANSVLPSPPKHWGKLRLLGRTMQLTEVQMAENRGRRLREGWDSWGRGWQRAPSPPAKESGERCKLSQRICCILGVTEHFRWKDNPIFSCKTDIAKASLGEVFIRHTIPLTVAKHYS